MKALEGVRVLELGSLLAGPVVGTLLGEFGAEVIKVEVPGEGDMLRRVGYSVNGTSLWWCVEGRNKKSITLSLRHPAGQRILTELVARSDIVVENFRPGTLETWGLGEETLRRVNPKLILVRVSGFGQTGPNRDKSSYDSIAVAYGGLTYVTGEPGRPPVRIGAPLGDYVSAVFGALGAVVALHHRESHSGGGQVVDVALYEPIWRFMSNLITVYDRLGIIRERAGGGSPGGTGVGGIFETRDGVYINVVVMTEAQFVGLARTLEREDILEYMVDKDALGRPTRQNEMERSIREWVFTRTRDDALSVLEANGVPCGPVNNAADVAYDSHYLTRGMIVEIDDPVAGKIKMPGVAPRLSDTPGSVETPAPLLGQHNEEIYEGLLGLSKKCVADLRDEGVI